MIQIYVLALSSLSGLGVVYLNPESILALCFFISFALLLHYGDGARQGLDASRDDVRSALVQGLLECQNRDASTAYRNLVQADQLLAGLKVLR